jgi:hypothetical protein
MLRARSYAAAKAGGLPPLRVGIFTGIMGPIARSHFDDHAVAELSVRHR